MHFSNANTLHILRSNHDYITSGVVIVTQDILSATQQQTSCHRSQYNFKNSKIY